MTAAMTLISTQPMALSANSRQQHYKMSMEFLSSEVNEPEPMDAEMTVKPSTPASVQAAPILQMPRYQPEQRPCKRITLPSLRVGCSPYSNGPYSAPRLPRIGSFSSIDSFGSANSAYSCGSSVASTRSSSSSTTSFLSINTSPVKCHDSLGDVESTSPATYSSSSSFSSIDAPLAAHAYAREARDEHQLQPSHSAMVANPLARFSHPTRPSYSEEQKFFIMYYRVVKGLPWPEIEDKFGAFFNLRTKSSLTSVYYRTRKNWGMEEVLKTGPDGLIGDRSKVESRAAHFTREFLTDLGYFE